MATFSRRQLLGAGAATAVGVLAAEGASSTAGAVTPAALRSLERKLKGRLLLPGTSGYLAASAPANGRYRFIRPVAVAQCANETDVVTCVDWAREQGVQPVARGGGHSYAGFSTTRGLLVDVAALNSVRLDSANGTAVSGGAALNRDLFKATVNGPHFLPGGTCLGVGVGGLVLGGGIGYNTHWAGLTCDHLQSTRVVTASGDVVTADPSLNADLFWACRGGAGGSFGINTQFTFSLVAVPNQVSWYRFDWTGADAALAVLDTFNHLIAGAPPALNAVAAATATPVGSAGPRGAIDVFSRGQYIGPVADLQDLVQPLIKAAGAPAKSVLTSMTFWDIYSMLSTPEPPSHSFGDVSRYAAAPVPEVVTSRVVDLLTRCPSRDDNNNGSFWSLGWVGGDVVNAVPRAATAYVHRDVSTLLRPTTVWSDDAPASVGRDLNDWTKAVVNELTPFTPDESYQNFPNRMIKDARRQYYGQNLPRLMAVKRKYDPQDLFHNPQSIPPR